MIIVILQRQVVKNNFERMKVTILPEPYHALESINQFLTGIRTCKKFGGENHQGVTGRFQCSSHLRSRGSIFPTHLSIYETISEKPILFDSILHGRYGAEFLIARVEVEGIEKLVGEVSLNVVWKGNRVPLFRKALWHQIYVIRVEPFVLRVGARSGQTPRDYRRGRFCQFLQLLNDLGRGRALFWVVLPASLYQINQVIWRVTI